MTWSLRIVDEQTGAELYERPCPSGDNAKLWARQWRSRRDGMEPQLWVVMSIADPNGQPWVCAKVHTRHRWPIRWEAAP